MSTSPKAMRGFLVLGGESTGTRLVTSILLAGGCKGSAEHEQPYDQQPFGDDDPVVLRRSVPHGVEHRWLDLSALLDRFAGREVTAVVTVRDWTCAARSQVQVGHVGEGPVAWDNRPNLPAGYVRALEAVLERNAEKNLARAYTMIFAQLGAANLPFRLVVYESLVLQPVVAQRRLLRDLGLNAECNPVAIMDGNAKHWRMP